MDTILLFDMDGVLLQPRGYHRALQKTVNLLGHSLGFEDPTLSQEQIFAFEAIGVTSEWDSSAICLGWMMRLCWEEDPDLPLPSTLHDKKQNSLSRSGPDWEELLNRLRSKPSVASDPLQAAQDIVTEALSTRHKKHITDLLENAHNPDSITHRTFQELVLGSDTYRQTYPDAPHLNLPGFLVQFDEPNLTQEETASCLAWLKSGSRAGCILTNRPSKPPGDLFGTPEAEIGANLVGLHELPLIGFGEMLWIAVEQGQPVHDFRKPGAAHALSALLAAAGVPTVKALKASASLTSAQEDKDPVWDRLSGSDIYIFEDTPAGIESVFAAGRVLERNSIPVAIKAAGIATDPQKVASLEEAGAVVYGDLKRALQDQFSLF